MDFVVIKMSMMVIPKKKSTDERSNKKLKINIFLIFIEVNFENKLNKSKGGSY